MNYTVLSAGRPRPIGTVLFAYGKGELAKEGGVGFLPCPQFGQGFRYVLSCGFIRSGRTLGEIVLPSSASADGIPIAVEAPFPLACAPLTNSGMEQIFL